MFSIISCFIIAYCLGSISSAVIISKLLKLPDPREHGSGNPGATNVLRAGNKTAAILVLICDLLKGVIPVLIARLFNLDMLATGFVGVIAIIGHILPVFFKFKGGKGVATAFGVIIALHWPVALFCLIVFIVVVALTRFVSLGSICAAIAAVLSVTFLGLKAYELPMVIILALVVWRHWANIMRLLDGTENKLSLFKKEG